MKVLNGAEVADFMQENQAHQVRSLRAQKIFPKLIIIRDSDEPVITKYVELKKQYGAEIGVAVEDWLRADVAAAIAEANADASVHGMIVQLPIKDMSAADEILGQIAAAKDVDGLAALYLHSANADMTASAQSKCRTTFACSRSLSYHGTHNFFESATATAINLLLASYDVELAGKRIALVGRGRLVGAPLERMWTNSGYDVTVFRSKSDLSELINFDIIVSATGVPHLIKSEMVRPGAVVVDAGTASEDSVLVGDIDESVRERSDLTAITPKIGGVGPLTVTTLFEHVLLAAKNAK